MKDFGYVPNFAELEKSSFYRNFELDSKLPDGREQIKSQKHSFLPNNTIIMNNQIVCKDYFMNSSDIDSKGCWRCENPCNKHAACVYPGKCQCLSPYKGDGIKCSETRLLITDATLFEEENKIIVRFLPNSEAETNITVLLSGNPLACVTVQPNSITCEIYNDQPSNLNISLDFNQKIQSKPFLVTRINQQTARIDILSFFIYGFICAIMINLIIKYIQMTI